MDLATVAQKCWGSRAKFSYLFIAAIFLLFSLLDGRELWTQEHRWADIVAGMFYRHDFLHPYLGEATYYDKPLLSYWLMAFAAKIQGQLNIWSLRIPSAMAGLAAVCAIYQLGCVIRDRTLGLVSGWLLITTFYFVFWARISSADMLNLAGSLIAVSWYATKRQKTGFFSYAIFFVIVALTCLCKGLVGAIIPFIAVTIDLILQKSWRQHMRPVLFLSMLPALLLYLIPFWASNHFSAGNYAQDGLYLVYRENILRYFHPFDHQDSIWVYFIYLPLYALPWSVLLIPAAVNACRRMHVFTRDQKWLTFTLIALFIFFTLSGSRRSYYILPVVPFAILFIADWLVSTKAIEKHVNLFAVFLLAAMTLTLTAAVIIPSIYYQKFGVRQFANRLMSEAEKKKPWSQWKVIMLDGESKLSFYLNLPPNSRNYSLKGEMRHQQEKHIVSVFKSAFKNIDENTIVVTRKRYANMLRPYFPDRMLMQKPVKSSYLNLEQDAPVAFIPVLKDSFVNKKM